MKDTKKFNYLLAMYLNGTMSFKEKADFFELIASGDYDNIVETQFESEIYELNGNLTKNVYSGKTENSSLVVSKSKKYNYRFWFSFAASVVCIISLATFYYLYNNKSSKSFLAAFKKNNLEKVVNSTNKSFPVSLPDGSIVTLQPNSSLYYTKNHFNNKREVCMEGEAIFNIVKDSLNPFYVYYQGIVTKVLGTSFNISTDKTSGNIEVKVFTGKVWVYENEQIFSDKNTNNGIIVTPNQKAVY
ncbi:MAG: FecR family protein, partial [Ferruginibacter sp.]|nr:FecR family protein [Ferruginibacter sp.]